MTGRSSGRPISLPIWFALDGNTLYLIEVEGSETEWHKNLRKQPSIRLSTRGKTFTTSARFLTDEAQIDQVLEQFRIHYTYFMVFTTPIENSQAEVGNSSDRPAALASAWLRLCANRAKTVLFSCYTQSSMDKPEDTS